MPGITDGAQPDHRPVSARVLGTVRPEQVSVTIETLNPRRAQPHATVEPPVPTITPTAHPEVTILGRSAPPTEGGLRGADAMPRRTRSGWLFIGAWPARRRADWCAATCTLFEMVLAGRGGWSAGSCGRAGLRPAGRVADLHPGRPDHVFHRGCGADRFAELIMASAGGEGAPTSAPSNHRDN